MSLLFLRISVSVACSSHGERQELERTSPKEQAHFKPSLAYGDILSAKAIQVTESKVKCSRVRRVYIAPMEVGGKEGLEIC